MKAVTLDQSLLKDTKSGESKHSQPHLNWWGLYSPNHPKTMNKSQTLKLARVLLDEAVTCALRNDIDDAKHLSKLSVMHEFKHEYDQVIAGDSEVFTMLVKNQYSKNFKVKFISRVLLDCLADDEQFIKTFKEKFIHLHLDFEGF